MWEANNIIVVDDDERRRHDAMVILDFLGENPVAYSCEQWSEVVARPEAAENTRQIQALLFAQSTIPLESRLKEAQQWDRSCPIIMIGTDEEEVVGDQDLRHKVIAQIDFPPSYNKMLDTLHRAQV